MQRQIRLRCWSKKKVIEIETGIVPVSFFVRKFWRMNMEGKSDNNKVMLAGKIVAPLKFQMEHKGEAFYRTILEVNRQSGQCDLIPLLLSQRLFDDTKNYEGQLVCVTGQFRSYNNHEQIKTRLLLHAFVKELNLLNSVEEAGSMNEILLNGFLCKPPVYRKTPLGREIADVLLAVNREYGRTDYIPCIVWGRNARFVSRLKVGNQVQVTGRIQSRVYEKIKGNETVKKRAYEVSIFQITKVA